MALGVVIGSYYALNPVLRDKVVELLERAHDMHAIIYYDPNFRSSHKEEAIKLAPTIIENLRIFHVQALLGIIFVEDVFRIAPVVQESE